MTELEQTLAQLLREWATLPMPTMALLVRTRDALALYDRMAQEIAQERTCGS